MRRHGRAARRHQAAEVLRIHERRAIVEHLVFDAMWSARALRDARAGAWVVAGPHGEVMRVDHVSLDRTRVHLTAMPVRLRPDLEDKYGWDWRSAEIAAEGHLNPSRPLFVRVEAREKSPLEIIRDVGRRLP